MKLTVVAIVLLLVGFSAPEFSEAQTAKASKSAKKKKVPRAENGEILPTKLPAFKGPKKVVVDFSENSIQRPTNIIGLKPMPLEQALEKSETEVVKSKSSSPVKNVLANSVNITQQATVSTATPKIIGTPSAQLPVPQALQQQPPQPVPQAEELKVVIAPEASTVEAMHTKWRAFAGYSYLNARYSQIQSDLKDGASSLAFGLSQEIGYIEGRAKAEFGHALDQEVSVANTRYFILEADAAYFFLARDREKPAFNLFTAVGLGYTSFNVRSYRDDGTSFLIREHLKAASALVRPSIGLRVRLGERLSLDLAVDYLTFIGAPQSSALQGLNTGLALGWDL